MLIVACRLHRCNHLFNTVPYGRLVPSDLAPPTIAKGFVFMTGSPQRRSLSQFGTEPLETWVERLGAGATVEQRYRAFLAISELAEPLGVYPHAIALLNDVQGELRAVAAHWMATAIDTQRLQLTAAEQAQLGQRLLGHLQDPDPDVRLAIARCLAYVEPTSPALADVISELLKDDEAHSSSLAELAKLCARVPAASERNLPRLQQLLAAEQAEVREAASLVFARHADAARSSVPQLVIALDDEEPVVREHAARALGFVNPLPADAQLALEEATRDEDEQVAAAARSSLQRP